MRPQLAHRPYDSSGKEMTSRASGDWQTGQPSRNGARIGTGFTSAADGDSRRGATPPGRRQAGPMGFCDHSVRQCFSNSLCNLLSDRAGQLLPDRIPDALANHIGDALGIERHVRRLAQLAALKPAAPERLDDPLTGDFAQALAQPLAE